MSENDELTNIPPMVPERDDVATHLKNKKAQSQDIVRPSYYTQKVKVSTWPVRIVLTILTLGMLGGGYGSYYFYEEYQISLRQSELRIGDLELRLAIAGEQGEESDSNLMENIEKTIEQYDLLWANWRNNNRIFEDIQGEIAKLKLANEGQDEATANNSQALANANQAAMANETRLNTLITELAQITQSVRSLNATVDDLSVMRTDLDLIRQVLNSGDSTVLGIVGRLEYIEESMESINAHRLQINESLFRLQENLEALQRAQGTQGSSL
ncbi:MAG: hypothetical protein O2971_01285 [Proteobacteria bacterium]|nr:hypothetical protein [Pseudomonadota bacterium]